MPKDYKDRVPGAWHGRRRRQHTPWVWLLPLLLVAIIGAAVLVQRFTGSDAELDEASAQRQPTASAEGQRTAETTLARPGGSPDAAKKKLVDSGKDKKATKPESPPDIDLPEPRFTFYKILPEKEVIVSEREIMNLQRQEKTGKRLGTKGFVVQVGAYPKLEDAEKTRARLASAKLKGKMEKVLIENAAWYRVKLGPYDSLVDAERVRAQLRQHHIDSVLQQAKPVTQ